MPYLKVVHFLKMQVYLTVLKLRESPSLIHLFLCLSVISLAQARWLLRGMQEAAERNTVVFKLEYREQSEVINPAHLTDRESNAKNISFVVKRL